MIQWFNKQMNRKRKGFTLIELIVVIAILGILAAIAIPRLGAFRDNAKTQADIATARTILSAATMAEANYGTAYTETNLNEYLDDISVTLIADGGTAAVSGWTLEQSDPMTVYKDAAVVTVP